MVKRSQKIATPNTKESQVFPYSFSFRFNAAANGTVLNDLSADDVNHYEPCADYTGLDHHTKDYHVYSKPELQTEDNHVYSKPELQTEDNHVYSNPELQTVDNHVYSKPEY